MRRLSCCIRALHGSFEDLNTGFEVELHSPKRGKSWRFEIENVNVVFEPPAGNDQYSQLVNTAKGGEVACKSEQNKILQVAPIP